MEGRFTLRIPRNWRAEEACMKEKAILGQKPRQDRVRITYTPPGGTKETRMRFAPCYTSLPHL